MSSDASLEIQKHLEPTERLLWSGQPKQGVLLRGSDALLIPFSLFWGGFAFFWEYSVLKSEAPPFFALFGIPFVAIGLYLIFGRFFVEAKQREKMYYGVTSERILIVSGLIQQKVRSLTLRTLSDVSLIESRNGSGSISFGNYSPSSTWFGGSHWPGMEQFSGPRFDLLSDPKQVNKLIRDAQRSGT